jgi:hypothetical protein
MATFLLSARQLHHILGVIFFIARCRPLHLCYSLQHSLIICIFSY